MITAPITAAKDVSTFFRTAPKGEGTDAETLTAEEVDALITDAPAAEGTEGTPEAFCPTDAGGVDWVLGKIAAARAEAKLIRENMEAMARACERDAEALEWKYGGALQHFLQAQTEGGKRKSVRFPHGVIGYRTRPAGVSVTDPAAALCWAQEHLPGAVTLHLDKKALSDRLTATGEALPFRIAELKFAAFQPAEEVFYIK